MICSKCNTQNPDGMNFCKHCGSPLNRPPQRNNQVNNNRPPQSNQGNGGYTPQNNQANNNRPPQGNQGNGGYTPQNNQANNNRPPQGNQGNGGYTPQNNQFNNNRPPQGNQVGQNYSDNYYNSQNNGSNNRPNNNGLPGNSNQPTGKSSNTGLIVALISVVALLLIAGVFVVLVVSGVFNGGSSADNTQATTTAAEVPTQPEPGSTDPNYAVIPNVVGMKSSTAYSMLANAKLSHEAKFEYSDTVPEDYVISQSPAADLKTDFGDTVTIVISRGPKPTDPPRSSSSNSSSSKSSGIGTSNDDRYGLRASSRLISRSDISWMTLDEIQLSINEIYAKHGYRFEDKVYKPYFESMSWYHPDTKDMELVASRMNYYEKENLKIMGSYRDDLL